jgi:hypothetical protein
LIAAEGSHEFGIDLRVTFEPGGNIGPRRYLDFTDKMPKRRRAEPMKAFDVTLAPEPRARLFLIKGGFWGRNSGVRS